MQNTRLNILLNVILQQIRQSLRNPWRRLSVLVIALLFGFFMGTAVSTLAGQQAAWDITVAAIFLVITEGISWLVYGSYRRLFHPLLLDILNALKLGLVYSLFVDALKLGS